MDSTVESLRNSDMQSTSSTGHGRMEKDGLKKKLSSCAQVANHGTKTFENCKMCQMKEVVVCTAGFMKSSAKFTLIPFHSSRTWTLSFIFCIFCFSLCEYDMYLPSLIS